MVTSLNRGSSRNTWAMAPVPCDSATSVDTDLNPTGVKPEHRGRFPAPPGVGDDHYSCVPVPAGVECDVHGTVARLAVGITHNLGGCEFAGAGANPAAALTDAQADRDVGAGCRDPCATRLPHS